MTLPAWVRTRHGFIGAAVLAAAGIFIVFNLRRSPGAPLKASAEFLSPTQAMVAPPPSFFERWVPMSWGWLWRLREAVQGPKETVSIQATVMEWPADSDAWNIELGAPIIQTNGMRGWVADEAALRKLEFELAMKWKAKRVMSPRVKTGHGILSTLRTGTSTAPNSAQPSLALKMDLLSKTQGDGIELLTRVHTSEQVTRDASSTPPAVAIYTNLDAFARWQIPPGNGCVVVGPPHTDGLRRSTILFSVQIQHPK